MKEKTKKTIPIIFLVYGLFYFLEPVLSGWFEIVNPSIFRILFLPFDWIIFLLTLPIAFSLSDVGENGMNYYIFLGDIVFAVVVVVYLIFCMKNYWMEDNLKKRRIYSLPLVVFLILFVITLPLGINANARHFNSFILGGRTLLMFAGGTSHVRDEAIEMMKQTTDENPSESELPSTLKRLNGWVEIEHDNHLVIVGFGRAYGMADEFGLILLEDLHSEPNSRYINSLDFHRLWKLEDGVYFYQGD